MLDALQARKADDVFFIRSRNSASFFKVTSVDDKPLTGDEAQQLGKRELASDLAKKAAEDTSKAALAFDEIRGRLQPDHDRSRVRRLQPPPCRATPPAAKRLPRRSRARSRRRNSRSRSASGEAPQRPATSRAIQQMRGSCSPASQSTIRPPPKAVRISTKWFGSSTARPMAEDCRAERMGPHGRDQPIGEFRRDDRHELAFVGDVERIEAEKLAGGGDFGAHRDRVLRDRKADAGLMRELVQRRRKAAARGIAHDAQGPVRPRRPYRRRDRAGRRCRKEFPSRIRGSRAST